MCFHTITNYQTKKLESRFKVTLNDEKFRPVFDKPNYHLNGFSHPNMLIIPQEKPELLAPGVWGIVPVNTATTEIAAYYKNAVRYGGGLNARSEKIFQHFIYRESALSKRCLIPVTGFFEPHEHLKKKYPFFIHRKDKEPIVLAGIYTVIDTYITFTILTKKASPLLAKIHNSKKRQPVMIDKTDEENWLSGNLNESDVKGVIESDYPEDELEAYTISKDLFNPKVDSNVESIIKKMHYPELNEM